MCFRFKIDEKWREGIGLLAGSLQILLAIFGLLLILFSVYLTSRVESYMLLLKDYNSGPLSYFLIAIGCLMIVIHGLGAKISYDLSYNDTRGVFRNITMAYFFLLCCLTVVLVAGGAVCFAHRSIIRDALKEGLYTALETYKTESYVKKTLDRLQLNFRCCGSKNYADWFRVSWISNVYIDLDDEAIKRHLRNGEYYSNSTPFSCCSVSYPRPCIHYHVISNNDNNKNNRSSNELSLYREGCTHALGSYFSDSVLLPAGNAVFIIVGVELLVLILLRHLHTSIVSAEEEGDPEGVGDGYCINECLCFGSGGDLARYTRKRDKDAEAKALDAKADADGENEGDDTDFTGGGGDRDDGFGEHGTAEVGEWGGEDEGADGGGGGEADGGEGGGADGKHAKQKQTKADKKVKKDRKETKLKGKRGKKASVKKPKTHSPKSPKTSKGGKRGKRRR